MPPRPISRSRSYRPANAELSRATVSIPSPETGHSSIWGAGYQTGRYNARQRLLVEYETVNAAGRPPEDDEASRPHLHRRAVSRGHRRHTEPYSTQQRRADPAIGGNAGVRT